MKVFAAIAGVVGTLVLAVLAILGVILFVGLIASIPALIVAGLWLIAGPALATATGVAALGTLTFWQTFAIAWIVMFLLGRIFRRNSAEAKVETTRSRW